MGALISMVAGFFGSGAGSKIGDTIANGAALAALTPVALWLVQHKEETAVALTWGDLAFFGGLLFVIIKIVHYTGRGGGA